MIKLLYNTGIESVFVTREAFLPFEILFFSLTTVMHILTLYFIEELCA